MLVLSRKKDQEICLPDLGVKFKILQMKGNTVRIGVDAPDDIQVLRGELNEFRDAIPEMSREFSLSFAEETDFEYQLFSPEGGTLT